MPPRTPKQKSPARAGAILLLLTPAQREACRLAAERDGMPLGTWIRAAALRAARVEDKRARVTP